MTGKVWSIFVFLFILYFYKNSFVDIYENFSIYFPFFNVTTYLDVIKYVAIPRFKTSEKTEQLFTLDELKRYNGENDNQLYISILGNVFDVSAGVSYYGVGQTYHHFTGRDASRAFLSGDFSDEGLIDDVLDLPLQVLTHLQEWLKMYETKYKYKGKLIGRYYDADGKPTDYNLQLQERFYNAFDEKNTREIDKQTLPPCNIQWTSDKGSRVWCTTRSGGIERNWRGVPRKFFMPNSKSYRCACVNKNNPNEHSISKLLVEYEECDPNSHSCYIKT